MKILLAALLIVGLASATDHTSIAGILSDLNASLRQDLLRVQTNYNSDTENVMSAGKKALEALAGDPVNGIKLTSSAFLEANQQFSQHDSSDLHAIRLQVQEARKKIDELMEKKYPQKP